MKQMRILLVYIAQNEQQRLDVGCATCSFAKMTASQKCVFVARERCAEHVLQRSHSARDCLLFSDKHECETWNAEPKKSSPAPDDQACIVADWRRSQRSDCRKKCKDV